MVSAVMVAYKGELYIEDALRSILAQLSFEDEIIVCDERPGSATGRIVRRIADEDSRVILIEGTNKGTVENFTLALRHCKGDRIYLCTQNDVWLPEKLTRTSELFDKGAQLIIHNAYLTDGNLNITDYSVFQKEKTGSSLIKNLRSNTLRPSLLAFDRAMLRHIMPIPKHLPSYSQWIGLVCRIYAKVRLLDLPLCYIRQQPDSPKSPADSKGEGKYVASKLYKRVFLNR